MSKAGVDLVIQEPESSSTSGIADVWFVWDKTEYSANYRMRFTAIGYKVDTYDPSNIRLKGITSKKDYSDDILIELTPEDTELVVKTLRALGVPETR